MVELLEFSNLIISAIESPKVNKWIKMVLFILKINSIGCLTLKALLLFRVLET